MPWRLPMRYRPCSLASGVIVRCRHEIERKKRYENECEGSRLKDFRVWMSESKGSLCVVRSDARRLPPRVIPTRIRMI